MAVLDAVTASWGAPRVIRIDNGLEFVSYALDRWAFRNDVVLDFSRSGKLTDNASVRIEFLSMHWLIDVDYVLETIEDCVESTMKRDLIAQSVIGRRCH